MITPFLVEQNFDWKYKNIYMNKENEYYLICDKGIYSNEVSAKLNKMGYNTHSIQGGYDKIKKNNSL